jgi:signal transduction histidine kinase/ActR/RegA family two-component response regulator
MIFSGLERYVRWMHRGPRTLSSYLNPEYLAASAVVFGFYVLTGHLGYYILFNLDSLPAIIWPPAGIALAAVFLLGYRLWLPIALAQLVLSLSAPIVSAPLIIMALVFGNTLQALIGGALLRRFGFVGSMANSRGVMVFLGVALCVSVVSPAILVGAYFLVDTNTTALWVNFSRGWAANVMSTLVLVPFLTPWFRALSSPLGLREGAETVAGLLAVVGATYLVFWTEVPSFNIFVALFFLFAALFWISLRLRPRFATLGLFLMAAFGLAGGIIASPSDTPLNQQLFASELFIILVVPIFLLLSAVVTERVRALAQYGERTRELESALERLSKEDRAKSEFIATLAHELRNPLSPVMSTLELLASTDVAPDVAPLIRSAQTQTTNMKRLLDDLLDAARLTQRTFSLQKEPVELAAVVLHSIESTRQYLESRNHRLSVSLPPTPLMLEADPVRLEQIIVNLLNNAGKYTNPGGTITIACRANRNELVLSVADSGIGIAPERIERVFEAFGGAEGNSRRPGGLRLGLSIAKRMAELHDGTLTVASAGPNQGSTFTLRLPLPEEPLRKPSAAPKAAVPATRRQILIVDDNEAAAVGLKKLLELDGHAVHAVHDGAAALEAVAGLNPEIVLLDLGLPDMDGYEVARQLNTAAPGAVPALVALTGFGQESDRRRTQEAGFAHHLTKPVTIAEVRRVIEQLASWKPRAA